ncbi:acetyl-CoA carboxylase biotin carboxyl carrier protein [Flavicella sp.]|uniref:acetyl-CoA carboxylase biotin carboxyl carrier protein n=1 Tax=Flavicella sp. TaxID=2957742 RepID=UPI003015FADC
MELKDIQNLIKFVAKSGASEVKLEMEDIKITVKTGPSKTETTFSQSVLSPVQIPVVSQVVPLAVAPVVPAAAVAAVTEENNESNLLTITSPIIGTFYRKPSPDKSNFIEIGDSVSADSVVCVIEAMKLFNEIESEVSGKIVKVLVDDSSPVEFGQPLFLVDPL